MSALPAVNPHDPLGATQARRAPTLYIIIAYKLIKGLLFLGLALALYTLSDNDLPRTYQKILHHLHLNPERRFWVDLASQVALLTEKKVVIAALGTLIYCLFSLVEGVGMIYRVSWAAWLAIGESAFFIPIEFYELVQSFSRIVLLILISNIVIVWYIFDNRHRLFHHAHLRHPKPEPSIPDG